MATCTNQQNKQAIEKEKKRKTKNTKEPYEAPTVTRLTIMLERVIAESTSTYGSVNQDWGTDEAVNVDTGQEDSNGYTPLW
jgi:hypothetical protein